MWLFQQAAIKGVLPHLSYIGFGNHNQYKQGASEASPLLHIIIVFSVRNPRSSGCICTQEVSVEQCHLVTTLMKAWLATASLIKQAAEIALYLYSSGTFY